MNRRDFLKVATVVPLSGATGNVFADCSAEKESARNTKEIAIGLYKDLQANASALGKLNQKTLLAVAKFVKQLEKSHINKSSTLLKKFYKRGGVEEVKNLAGTIFPEDHYVSPETVKKAVIGYLEENTENSIEVALDILKKEVKEDTLKILNKIVDATTCTPESPENETVPKNKTVPVIKIPGLHA